MPVMPLPPDVPACHDRIRQLEIENTELRVRAEQTVGGFLERNGKSIIAIALGIVAALGGGNLIFNGINHEKIDKAQTVQQEIKVTAEETAKRTDEVGTGVDDIKREVRKKKGPFGE